MTELEWPRQRILMCGGHLSVILVIECRTKPVFELEQEVDENKKFGRNQIKNNWVRVTTTANIDGWRPFCRPSWLSDVGQNPYSNLNEKLIEAIHIQNLVEIRLKMTELEWPRQRILLGGGHFVGHLGYRMSDKTHVQTWMKGWWKQSIYKIWKKSD